MAVAHAIKEAIWFGWHRDQVPRPSQNYPFLRQEVKRGDNGLDYMPTADFHHEDGLAPCAMREK